MRVLARVAGPRLGIVRLTDQFVPTAIQPDARTEAVELDNLSGGEQEQLFLVTRLALGKVLAKDERQLVVLDDVLNATDSGRLARVLTLLEEAADRLQIVILTCHPERYRALEAATFFDLRDSIPVGDRAVATAPHNEVKNLVAKTILKPADASAAVSVRASEEAEPDDQI